MRKQRTMTNLVKHISHIAHALSDLIATCLEQNTTHTALRAAYQHCCEANQSAMTIAEFADMASQLLVYSYFVARYYHNETTPFQRKHITSILSFAHPLHRQCVEAITGMQPECAAVASCSDELMSLLATADRESINSSFQDDPLAHFYELFLHYYNPRLRASHGIFYTPEPIVSYMVRSIDQLLRSRFACADGLAEIDADLHILDPACGTGIFPQAMLEHIYAIYQQRGQAEQWRDDLRQHFLPRLTGIEVLMTPYLIAHLRLNLFLAEGDSQGPERSTPPDYGRPGPGRPRGSPLQYTDYATASLYDRGDPRGRPGTGRPGNLADNASENANEQPMPFHLGNALIEPDIIQDASSPIMIVLGNPPYAGHSANKEAWIMSLLDEYKEGCPELKKRAQAKWLSDDYVKFLRLAQWQIERAGQGILAFITNHSYLDNPTFRGMRRSLMHSFDELYVLDLHGNSKKQELAPGDIKDENIFAIQSGVAISIFVKTEDRRSSSSPKSVDVHHAHLWGSRAEKLTWLSIHDLESTAWTIQHPQAPYYLFAPQETQRLAEYEAGWSIPDIFCLNGDPAPGIITCHDEFAIAWSRDEAISKVERLQSTRGEDEARQYFRLCTQKQWNYAAAKRALSDDSWRQQLTPLLYRPFDARWTVYNRHIAVHLRERVTRHMLAADNLALLVGKAGQVIHQQAWDIVFCSRLITEFNLFRRGGNNLFPLYLAHKDSKASRPVNLAPAFIADVVDRLGLEWIVEGQGDLQHTIGPEDIFSYIYAILYSPAYRARYASFLKRDFPRIPLTCNLALFRALCCLGHKLVRLHLVEEEMQPVTTYPVGGENRVERVSFLASEQDKTTGCLWINAAQYFANVPRAAWTLHIGGYQVCQKWLKDRRGRVLSGAEIAHYQQIVAILAETSCLMGEIDSTLEMHEEWPGWEYGYTHC